MPPSLTLLSFAGLGSSRPPPAYEVRQRRTNILDPRRWLPLHVEPLKIVVSQADISVVVAETGDKKADREIKIIELFLRTLMRPAITHHEFLNVAWTLAHLLSPNPESHFNLSPAAINNAYIIEAFLWLINAATNPALQLTTHGAYGQTIQSFARSLRFRHHSTCLIPDMCIVRDPLYGPLPFFIPVLFPESHQRPRTPLSREVAFILAYAQERFPGADAAAAPARGPLSVRVVILRFSRKETFLVGADVERRYLDSIERYGVAAKTLDIWTSDKWNLETEEGRWGFFVGMKNVFEKVFPPVIGRREAEFE